MATITELAPTAPTVDPPQRSNICAAGPLCAARRWVGHDRDADVGPGRADERVVETEEMTELMHGNLIETHGLSEERSR